MAIKSDAGTCPGEGYDFWHAQWIDGTHGLFFSTAESQSASFTDTVCSAEAEETYGASCSSPDPYHSHNKVLCNTTKQGKPYGKSSFCMMECQECEYDWDWPPSPCATYDELEIDGLLYCVREGLGGE